MLRQPTRQRVGVVFPLVEVHRSIIASGPEEGGSKREEWSDFKATSELVTREE